jgi:endonuclease YncB( thermonuclease family)
VDTFSNCKPQKEMTLKPFKTLFLSISLLFLLVTNNSVNAEAITGTIDSVIEGDLITIISKGKEVEIRLFGIDTPEKTQAFGQSAKNFTGAMASKGEIRVEPKTKDQSGKIVGLVFVNGINLNEQIVSQGFGWVYRQYCKERFCADWLKLESNAKGSQKGLWANANPTPPWEYRKNQRSGGEGNGLKLTAAPSASVKIVPSGPAAYHGNIKDHVFHSAACKEFNCPTCKVNFQSISEALDAGYRPHRECITK